MSRNQFPASPLSPIALAAALTLLSAGAHAQTAAASSDGTKSLSTVTVEASADASAEGLAKPYAGGQVARGSRIGILGTQDMMDTPFSATGYTHDLIQNQQARSIGDVLLNDASVRTTRGFGNFQQAYFIRGFVVYSDDVAYNGLYGLVPRQYTATEFVERVEMFRGANAFVSGAGAGSTASGGIGGMINVVPKRAPNDPLSQVTVGVQSGGEGYAAADIARRFGPDQSTGIRLNLATRNGEGAVDNEKTRMDAFAVGLDWRSSNVRLSADLGYQKDNLKQPRQSVFPGTGVPIPKAPDASSNFAQPWTYSNAEDTFGTVRGEWDVTDNVTTWAALGARRSTEANVLTRTTLTNVNGNTDNYRFDNARKDEVLTGEIGVRGKFRTGSVGHTVVGSAAAFDLKSRNAFAFGDFITPFGNNIYTPTAIAAPPATTFLGGVLSNPRETERVKTTSYAVADTLSFAQDTVLLTVGARHQTIEDTNWDPTTGALVAGAAGSNPYNMSRTSPVAGLVYKLTPQVSLYGNYIEGLVKGDTVTTGVTTPVVFAPFVSKQKEIGAKYDGGNVGASIALFSTSKPSAYATGGVAGVYGEQRNQGVELALFGEPVKGLRLLGGVSFIDAELRNTVTPSNNGHTAVGVPKFQANIGAEWDVPGVQRLSLNARVLNTGKQYADAENTQTVPSWTRTDIGARYLVDLGSNRLLTLRARVENLFDKNYWASTGGYPGYGYLVLGAPRNFVLSASVDF